MCVCVCVCVEECVEGRVDVAAACVCGVIQKVEAYRRLGIIGGVVFLDTEN